MEEKEIQRVHLIIAPHPDDEIIGCYEILEREKNILILYSSDVDFYRKEEALKLREENNNIKGQLFQNTIPPPFLSKKETTTFYFPDPVNEIHPTHRVWGMNGESLARSGYDVIFYTTIMNVPYIHEVNSDKKESLLNKIYSSQKSLWEYEKKFVLFEGRCKWLF
jgi:hypothetical protein